MERLSIIDVLLPELRAAIERKDGYIMGARGQNPRTGYLDLSETKCKSAWEVSGWYYTQYLEAPYTPEQYQQALYWREHATRVWDCNGLAEGIYELHTGVNIDSKARFNYSEWCNPRGANMSELPRVAGVAVFMHSAKKGYITHVGYLLEPVVAGKPEGDWWVCEARGVMYGVVKTKLSQRGWNRWGVMSRYYDYGDAFAVLAKSDSTYGRYGHEEVLIEDLSVLDALKSLLYDVVSYEKVGNEEEDYECPVREMFYMYELL